MNLNNPKGSPINFDMSTPGSPCYCSSKMQFFDCCYKSKQSDPIFQKSAGAKEGSIRARIFNQQGKCMFPGCKNDAAESHLISEKSQLGAIAQKASSKGATKAVITPISARKKDVNIDRETPPSNALKAPIFCNENGFRHDSILFKYLDNAPKNFVEDRVARYTSAYRSICGILSLKIKELEFHRDKETFEMRLSKMPSKLTRQESNVFFYEAYKEVVKQNNRTALAINKLIAIKHNMDGCIEIFDGSVQVAGNHAIHVCVPIKGTPPILISSCESTTFKNGDMATFAIHTIQSSTGWELVQTIFPLDEISIAHAKLALDLHSKRTYGSEFGQDILLETLLSCHEIIAINPEWVAVLTPNQKSDLNSMLERGRDGNPIDLSKFSRTNYDSRWELDQSNFYGDLLANQISDWGFTNIIPK